MATLTVECPFCHTSSDPAATGGYCDSCGKRLPVSAAYTKSKKGRRLTGDLSTAEPEAHQPKNQTAGALVTAAVLRLLLGSVYLPMGPLVLGKTGVPEWYMGALLGFTAGGTAFYGLMALWALRAPPQAAITALGGFLAIWGVVLIGFPPVWPLALGDVLLLGWLGYAIWVSRHDRV